jgi:hypothetical protein
MWVLQICAVAFPVGSFVVVAATFADTFVFVGDSGFP